MLTLGDNKKYKFWRPNSLQLKWLDWNKIYGLLWIKGQFWVRKFWKLSFQFWSWYQFFYIMLNIYLAKIIVVIKCDVPWNDMQTWIENNNVIVNRMGTVLTRRVLTFCYISHLSLRGYIYTYAAIKFFKDMIKISTLSIYIYIY